MIKYILIFSFFSFLNLQAEEVREVKNGTVVYGDKESQINYQFYQYSGEPSDSTVKSVDQFNNTLLKLKNPRVSVVKKCRKLLENSETEAVSLKYPECKRYLSKVGVLDTLTNTSNMILMPISAEK